ncbi:MAG: hypothetical protein ACXWLR_03130, partial [Myxococcales bacterium]
GAAAALSRSGRIDEALAARAKVWKEQPRSALVPRALLAAASDLAATGELGEAAALLERYAAGYQKQVAEARWRRKHPAGKKAAQEQALYDEEKAQSALHDAAVLREARGELQKALADRTLSLQLWPRPQDLADQRFAAAQLRARLGEPARAAREMAAIARGAKDKAALEIAAWREAARLYARAEETGNAQWSWTQLERAYRALSPKVREKLPLEAVAAAAEAHFALGAGEFDRFQKQQIRQPLMATLNRKIALLQAVKKRAEETVAMRQAEPAVCALTRLGEAQMLLGRAIATSPNPPGLSAEQRKLYRAALTEKAQPLYGEARQTLQGAAARARELGVGGGCAQKIVALLEKVSAKMPERTSLGSAPAPAIDRPEMVDARGVQGERARRLVGEAVEKFRGLSQEMPSPVAQFDLGVALDAAGQAMEAEQAYRAVAAAKGAVGYEAAARAAALAAMRGDAKAARENLTLARDALGDGTPARVLQARIELVLGNAAGAQAAAKGALARSAGDAGALSALARAQLAQGQPGVARIFAARAVRADPLDPDPLLVTAEIARAAGDSAGERSALQAAVELDPDWAPAQFALGRALFERGEDAPALAALQAANELDPASYPAALAYGQALAAANRPGPAKQALARAVTLSPRAAEPHFELARLKLYGDGDAQAALQEAKLFLTLSTQPPPAGHPIHALVQRCEEALKQRAQASVVQKQ